MPRSPSRNERDRRDRDRHRPSSTQKDYSNDVAKMKEKMRSTLEIARKSESSQQKKQEKKGEELMSAEEHLARSKAIQEIEEGGFQPASFRSGSQTKKDPKAKKETSHEAAIFGPAWKSAEQRKVIEKKESDISTITLPSAPPPPMNAMVPMVASHMSSELDEQRKEEWRVYWKEVRHELLQGNC